MTSLSMISIADVQNGIFGRSINNNYTQFVLALFEKRVAVKHNL